MFRALRLFDEPLPYLMDRRFGRGFLRSAEPYFQDRDLGQLAFRRTKCGTLVSSALQGKNPGLVHKRYLYWKRDRRMLFQACKGAWLSVMIPMHQDNFVGYKDRRGLPFFLLLTRILFVVGAGFYMVFHFLRKYAICSLRHHQYGLLTN